MWCGQVREQRSNSSIQNLRSASRIIAEQNEGGFGLKYAHVPREFQGHGRRRIFLLSETLHAAAAEVKSLPAESMNASKPLRCKYNTITTREPTILEVPTGFCAQKPQKNKCRLDIRTYPDFEDTIFRCIVVTFKIALYLHYRTRLFYLT